jgi:hypothetical protein
MPLPKCVDVWMYQRESALKGMVRRLDTNMRASDVCIWKELRTDLEGAHNSIIPWLLGYDKNNEYHGSNVGD